jgi:hypothetical protein
MREDIVGIHAFPYFDDKGKTESNIKQRLTVRNRQLGDTMRPFRNHVSVDNVAVRDRL